tara:strand:- start:35 stop:352 length:318 start_codon:yes stop_codon:yes gene_type:complete
MNSSLAKFFPGQLIQHRRFEYRGVIVDVDINFRGTHEWYEKMARSKPRKDKPWYHVLVNDSYYMTYVAEQNLETDNTHNPINHPALGRFFTQFKNGCYIAKVSSN